MRGCGSPPGGGPGSSQAELAERAEHWPAEAQRAWAWLQWRFGERAAEVSRNLVEPGAAAKRLDLGAGETIVISTVKGGQGGDLSFPGFDQALTRNINGWERFGEPWLVFAADPGMRLYDGEGRRCFEVGECVGDGRNDIMYPGCWSELYEDGRQGCRDLIAGALGIERREHYRDALVLRQRELPTMTPIEVLVRSRCSQATTSPSTPCATRPIAVFGVPDTAIPGWHADQPAARGQRRS